MYIYIFIIYMCVYIYIYNNIIKTSAMVWSCGYLFPPATEIVEI